MGIWAAIWATGLKSYSGYKRFFDFGRLLKIRFWAMGFGNPFSDHLKIPKSMDSTVPQKPTSYTPIRRIQSQIRLNTHVTPFGCV